MAVLLIPPNTKYLEEYVLPFISYDSDAFDSVNNIWSFNKQLNSRVHCYAVEQAYIPCSFYTINSNNNVIQILSHNAGSLWVSVTIPSGRYAPTDLATAINQSVSAQTGTGGAAGTTTINLNVKWDNTTRRFVWALNNTTPTNAAVDINTLSAPANNIVLHMGWHSDQAGGFFTLPTSQAATYSPHYADYPVKWINAWCDPLGNDPHIIRSASQKNASGQSILNMGPLFRLHSADLIEQQVGTPFTMSLLPSELKWIKCNSDIRDVVQWKFNFTDDQGRSLYFNEEGWLIVIRVIVSPL